MWLAATLLESTEEGTFLSQGSAVLDYEGFYVVLGILNFIFQVALELTNDSNKAQY